MSDRLKVGLTIHVTAYTGWGTVALGLAKSLAAREDVELYFWSVDWRGIDPLTKYKLEPLFERSRVVLATPHARNERLSFDGVLIYADGNHFHGRPEEFPVTSDRNVGLMVFEDTAFTPDELERAKAYQWLVTASKWNQDILAGYGVSSHLVHQGIDPTVFHPAPKAGLFADRFVVFSGGKLEYRKGQDIVLAAFKEFHAKHPDALLVTCWNNPWPQLAVDMTLNGHVEHEPEAIYAHGTGGATLGMQTGVDIEGWFEDNGLPDDAALDLGLMPNAFLGPILREADVAVFMSRAEGATNLMAMEAIASGIPTFLSSNTGHADISHHTHNFYRGPKPKQPSQFAGIDGWEDTSPDFVAQNLECFYEDLTVMPPPQLVRCWADYANDLVRLVSA